MIRLLPAFCLLAGQVSAQLAVSAPASEADVLAGKALFERHWVSPPASTAASDGLGPYYNATSCDTCHPAGGEGRHDWQVRGWSPSLVVHFMDADTRERLGKQWQPHAVRGMAPELVMGFPVIEETRLAYPDGLSVPLQRPTLRLQDNPQLAADTVVSLRLAPALFGADALERAQLSSAQTGRFGWQASEADLPAQVAAALSRDLGLGSPLTPEAGGDCPSLQSDCLELAARSLTGTAPELSQTAFDLIVAYVRSLPPPAVPAPDDTDQGFRLFDRLGCGGCHQPELAGTGGQVLAYTDLALHDLGDGLADRTLAGEPVPTRWRTPPLWMVAEKLAAGQGGFLHDGRASSPEQAVLWHGGEAGRARDAFIQLDAKERRMLLDWLSKL